MYVCMRTCYSAPSRFLLRGAPDYSADTESEFHAEAHEQLRVKDLPRVPTRWLEVDSNSQPSGCKAPNIPLHHRAPQLIMAVGLTGHWKVTLGYFLITGISSVVQVKVIQRALIKLGQIGIRSLALFMDGHATNQGMVSQLGRSLE